MNIRDAILALAVPSGDSGAAQKVRLVVQRQARTLRLSRPRH